MTSSASRLPRPWIGLEPYVQLVRALMPRAQSIALFDKSGQLRFLSESTAGSHLSETIEEVLQDRALASRSDGLMRRVSEESSDCLFYLREGERLVAILAMAMKHAAIAEPSGFNFVQSLLRPALEVLRRDLALDDFGTGLSSLSYLRTLPVDVLKVDGSFVRDILRDTRSESMVAAIAQLARGMSIETVAEYVETDEIRTRIATLGLDYGQGYAIGRPTPLAEILLELPVISASYPLPPESGDSVHAGSLLH
jgi:hypothetical protein